MERSSDYFRIFDVLIYIKHNARHDAHATSFLTRSIYLYAILHKIVIGEQFEH